MHYKNVTDQELTVTGVGIVPAGGTVEIEGEFRSPNFREAAAPLPDPVAPIPPPAPPAQEPPAAPTEQANQD